MLYVTTRNNRDAFTARKVLTDNRASDGGFYLPFRAPHFLHDDVQKMLDQSFGQNVADILNLLFNTKLTSWDVDFTVGRYPVRLTQLRHRILLAESWHNPDGDYARMVRNLVSHLQDQPCTQPGNWAAIAVRIATLFGIFADLKKIGIEQADIAVVSGDFSAPISAWYAREWGLPIGNIICCCNENNNLWELICHGQLRTDVISMPTKLPDADISIPDNLERLIYECGGSSEVECYTSSIRNGRPYYPSDAMLSKLRKGLFISVASSKRVETTIPSVYRTHDYLLTPYSALAYAGLLDYRAKTGQTRPAVVLADQSPICYADYVSEALGLPISELNRLI